MLNTSQWDTLQQLFHLAEEAVPEERERFLASHCDDSATCRQVLSMLRASDRLAGQPALKVEPRSE